jgi:hypothetical protein
MHQQFWNWDLLLVMSRYKSKTKCEDMMNWPDSRSRPEPPLSEDHKLQEKMEEARKFSCPSVYE